MNKPIIVFGIGKISGVISYYIENYFNRKISAFTVNRKYISDEIHNNLPVIAFEEIRLHYPPDEFDMFIAMGYQNMNNIRQEKFEEARLMGYNLISLIPHDFSVAQNVVYGSNCFIMPGAIIHPHVVLEDNVFIWGGALVGHHSSINSNSWVTSSANIAGGSTIGRNCFLSVNSTIGNSIEVGDYCFLGANCLITKSTKQGEVFVVESTKASRLNSNQFLRFSKFDSL